VAPPLFETPAPLIRKVIVAGPKPDAILDPYAVFAQGEDLLIDQLAALDPQHLRHIVRRIRDRVAGNSVGRFAS